MTLWRRVSPYASAALISLTVFLCQPLAFRLIGMVLRAPLFGTPSAAVANLSRWQYGEDRPGWYTTSLLGILNGYLPEWFGKVLVFHYDNTIEWPTWPYLTLEPKSW